MAYLDVYPNASRKSADLIPYVLEVQSDFLHVLSTTVVVPLYRPEFMDAPPLLRLNPAVEVNGERLILVPQELASIPRRLLKTPTASLAARHSEIVTALDALLTNSL
ncbi:MAG: CcdB family protein [Azoarcus sp.]|jgi:toxin CcdB|nr:CcdB family protein [Azoarcus sp.]